MPNIGLPFVDCDMHIVLKKYEKPFPEKEVQVGVLLSLELEGRETGEDHFRPSHNA